MGYESQFVALIVTACASSSPSVHESGVMKIPNLTSVRLLMIIRNIGPTCIILPLSVIHTQTMVTGGAEASDVRRGE